MTGNAITHMLQGNIDADTGDATSTPTRGTRARDDGATPSPGRATRARGPPPWTQSTPPDPGAAERFGAPLQSGETIQWGRGAGLRWDGQLVPRGIGAPGAHTISWLLSILIDDVFQLGLMTSGGGCVRPRVVAYRRCDTGAVEPVDCMDLAAVLRPTSGRVVVVPWDYEQGNAWMAAAIEPHLERAALLQHRIDTNCLGADPHRAGEVPFHPSLYSAEGEYLGSEAAQDARREELLAEARASHLDILNLVNSLQMAADHSAEPERCLILPPLVDTLRAAADALGVDAAWIRARMDARLHWPAGLQEWLGAAAENAEVRPNGMAWANHRCRAGVAYWDILGEVAHSTALARATVDDRVSRLTGTFEAELAASRARITANQALLADDPDTVAGANLDGSNDDHNQQRWRQGRRQGPPVGDVSEEVGAAAGDCPICQDDFSPDGDACVRTLCGHYFHRDCLDQALRHRAECPTCRREFESRPAPPSAPPPAPAPQRAAFRRGDPRRSGPDATYPAPPPRRRRRRDATPLGAIDWEVNTGWRNFLDTLDRSDIEYNPFSTVSELGELERRAYGAVELQVIRRVNATGDPHAAKLLAVLPRLLLTDRRRTRNGANVFLDRVAQVIQLRDLAGLFPRMETRHRRRLVATQSDERTRTDVLSLCRKTEYGRAGKALMRGEVARGTPATAAAVEPHFPDRTAELDAFNEAHAGEALPPAEHLDRAVFMHQIGADETGRIPIGKAADAQGRRWEHIGWCVEAGGAEDLYELADKLFTGDLDLPWIDAGRLVNLRKKDDAEDQESMDVRRDIRPLGVPNTFFNLIGATGVRQFGPIFAAVFDPQGEADWNPYQAGGSKSGMQQVQHSVIELLHAHPEYGVLQLDAISAFQNCSRRKFLERILAKAPGAYRWAKRCYSRPAPRYLRMEDGSFRIFWQSAGTTQGDPFGPVDHNFSIDELIAERLQPLVQAGVLYYLDDGTVVGPVEELARFINELVDEESDNNFYENTGMRLNIAKCSIWTLATAFPAGDDALFTSAIRSLGGDLPLPVAEEQRILARRERERLRAVFPASVHGMRGLREPAGDRLAAEGSDELKAWRKDAHLSQGVRLLGSPVVGTSEFVAAELDQTITDAEAYVARAQAILLSGDHYYAHEYMQLMRVTLPGRFTHHCSAVFAHELLPAARRFDELQRAAYEAAVGRLTSSQLDAAAVVHSPVRWGGRGFVSAERVAAALSFNSWAQSHAHIRNRLAEVRRLGEPSGGQPSGVDTPEALERAGFAQLSGALRHTFRNAPLTFSNAFGIRLRARVLECRATLAAEWEEVRARAFPIFAANAPFLTHHRRSLERAAEALDVSQYETDGRSVARTLSAVSHALAFTLNLTAPTTTAAGRAALLESATANASDFVRARAPDPDAASAPRFARFADSRAAVVAHQSGLFIRPAVPAGCMGCGVAHAWATDTRHLAGCPCGMRASDTLHHPLRDLLAEMLKEAFGAASVAVEPSDYRLYSALKRPDIVVYNASGPGRHLLIDVKTVDATGTTHLANSHTDRFALGGLTEAERDLRNEYTDGGRHPEALDRWCTLLCAAVGRHGGIGRVLSDLIQRCARMRGGRTGVRDVNAVTDAFVAVWRHRISLTVAACATARIVRNAVQPAHARAMQQARAAEAVRHSSTFHRRGSRQPPRAAPLSAAPPRLPPPVPAPDAEDGGVPMVGELTDEVPEFDCHVCGAGFAAEGQGRVRTPCGHVFHRECLDTALQRAPECPECRCVFPSADRSRDAAPSRDTDEIGEIAGEITEIGEITSEITGEITGEIGGENPPTLGDEACSELSGEVDREIDHEIDQDAAADLLGAELADMVGEPTGIADIIAENIGSIDSENDYGLPDTDGAGQPDLRVGALTRLPSGASPSVGTSLPGSATASHAASATPNP